jgi:hypothetical protein
LAWLLLILYNNVGYKCTIDIINTTYNKYIGATYIYVYMSVTHIVEQLIIQHSSYKKHERNKIVTHMIRFSFFIFSSSFLLWWFLPHSNYYFVMLLNPKSSSWQYFLHVFVTKYSKVLKFWIWADRFFLNRKTKIILVLSIFVKSSWYSSHFESLPATAIRTNTPIHIYKKHPKVF